MNKRTNIDLSLPKPQQTPVIIVDNILNVGLVVEGDEGIDGGCQVKHTNLQEGVCKGGKILESDRNDNRRDLRTLDSKSSNSSNHEFQTNFGQR